MSESRNAFCQSIKERYPAIATKADAEFERQWGDVAFVENLFWQVPQDRGAVYWIALPENLKRPYIDFYHRSPL